MNHPFFDSVTNEEKRKYNKTNIYRPILVKLEKEK